MPPRSAAHHEGDTRRNIKGKDPYYLRAYIARHALRMRVADQELVAQGYQSELSPALHLALNAMRGAAAGRTGRQEEEV